MRALHVADGLFLPDLHIRAAQPTGSLAERLVASWSEGEVGYAVRNGALWIAGERLWDLIPEDQAALGVVPYGGRVRVKDFGSVGGTGYIWRLIWDQRDARAQGCWLEHGDNRLLLAAHHAALVALAERVAGSPRDEALRRIAELKDLARRCGDIVLEGVLRTQDVYTPTRVRIELGPGDVPRPVLATVDEAGVVQPVPLTPEQVAFIIGIISRGDGGGIATPPGGPTVLVPEAAARMAFTVDLARVASKETRDAYIQDPGSFLDDASAFDEADYVGKYGDRIRGVGAPKRIPTTRTEATHRWFDDTESLLLDDGRNTVWVPAEHVRELRDALVVARAKGATAANWGDPAVSVPVSVLDLLPAPGAGDGDEKAPAGSRPAIKVLLIHENEAELTYARHRTPERRYAISNDIPGLQVGLKPHQVDGVTALQTIWRDGWRGALLCDDMGLGKTLQALAFASWVARVYRTAAEPNGHDEQRPYIPIAIVAPPSLLRNWFNELEERFADDAFYRDGADGSRILWGQDGDLPRSRRGRLPYALKDVLNVKGSKRDAVLQSVELDVDRLQSLRPDILFIGYDTLRRNQIALGQVRFGCILADEAQEVKEPNTLRSIALRAMDAEFALVLTGTPIENRWRDLWTLCDFALPGYLGTLHEFSKTYPDPSPPHEPPAGARMPEGSAPDLSAVGSALREKLGPLLIRRTRDLVLPDLPPLEVVRQRHEMPPEQAMAYRAVIVARRGAAVLKLLQDLARVSLHPRVNAVLSTRDEALAWVKASARTTLAWEALGRYHHEGRAVLLFVRNRAMQATLEQALRLTFGVQGVPVLNGDVAMDQRMNVVQAFEQAQGFRVLLISTDVGGAGWNLQFAARAIILERPYNPATEAQMIGRVHRLGQTARVEVVVPISTMSGTRTFDDVLDSLLDSRVAKQDAVLAPAAALDVTRGLGTQLESGMRA